MKIKPLLTLVLLINLFSLSGCKIESARKYSTEDFIYCYIKEPGSSIIGKPESCDYVAILELTEVGKTKDVIIIPEEIDGRPVVQIGAQGLGYLYEMNNGEFKHIYFPKSISYLLPSVLTEFRYTDAKYYFLDIDNYDWLNIKEVTYITRELYEK